MLMVMELCAHFGAELIAVDRIRSDGNEEPLEFVATT
jgi:hypothetical protein